MTGAKISLTITNTDSNNVYPYYSDDNLRPSMRKAHVKIQHGLSFVEEARAELSTPRNQAAVDTPTKIPAVPTPTPRPIRGLPGKKVGPAAGRPMHANQSAENLNKCGVCKVIYMSKEDKSLARKHGKQNEWLGCDAENCSYWAHARCANIKVPRGKRVSDVAFVCPKHK
jgi:hypothetical protein